MENKKEILEFENLFEEEPKNKSPHQQPENRNNYVSAILYYLLIMFVVGGAILAILKSVPSLQITYSENELILQEVSFDPQGLAVMSSSDYEIYREDYQDYMVTIGEFQNFIILTSIDNSYYDDAFYKIDELTGESVLDMDKIELIFSSNPTITFWDNDHLSIHIYAGKNQDLPSFFEVEYQVITGPKTELNDFGLAIATFLIYLILLPGLLLILKKDFIYDFNEIKTRKNQWFSILIISYLYLILGNIISNYASTFISDIFNIARSDAENQISIIGALNSSGVILTVLATVIIGPIVEELIFRKSFFSLIKNDKWALILSSLIFGSIHLFGEANILAAIVNGLSYYVMGFIFGYIYLKNNKNIFVPIAVHILSNAISVIAILFIL